MNQITFNSVTVPFASAPQRPGGEEITIYQPEGWDSSGAQYVYDKSNLQQVVHSVVLPKESDASLEDLKALLDSAQAAKGLLVWQDHLNVNHNVHYAPGSLQHIKVGLDRHRVEFQFVEYLPWVSPSAPVSFSSARNLKAGAAPVWIIRMIINGVNYWLSDIALSIGVTNINTQPGWPSGLAVTTLPWVAAWGELQESVTGAMNEIQMSDFTCELLNDPDATPGMITLVETYPLEQSPVELYQWYIGLNPLTDPPQLKFRGYCTEPEIVDTSSVRLTIQDESARLMRSYVGRRLSLTDYPGADPDDVGKVVPIPYGTVKKVRALAVDAGKITTLTADISATATSIILTTAVGLTTGKQVTIDAETLNITNVVNNTITVTRAYGGTTAATHSKGATVAEKKTTPLVYMAADVAIDTFGQVQAKIGEEYIDITTACSLYTGKVGSSHASYPGKAVVTITDFAKVTKLVTLTAAENIAVASTAHNHAVASTFTEVSSTSLPVKLNPIGTNSTAYWLYFPASAGTRTEMIYEISVDCTLISTIRLDVGNSGTVWLYSVNGTASINIVVPMGSRDKLVNYCVLNVVAQNISGQQATITSAKRTITISNSATAATTSAVSKTGTVTLSGNSIADTVVGSSLYVDMTRNIYTPALVCQDLINNIAAPVTLIQEGTFPASYRIDGVITDYRTVLEWCDLVAFQSRAWFKLQLGKARLIVRSLTPTSIKNISTCAITDDGRLILSSQRSAAADIINVINLLYNRDQSLDGDNGYQATLKVTDATSVSVYGSQERPELFKFDFVTSAAMAADVAAFYLAYCKSPHWRHTFTAFLDQSELKFGDSVIFAIKTNTAGYVIAAGISPGSMDNIDCVKLTVEV